MKFFNYLYISLLNYSHCQKHKHCYTKRKHDKASNKMQPAVIKFIILYVFYNFQL